MSFMLIWLFPEKGRENKIETKGHPTPTIISAIEDCVHYGHITRRDLLTLALNDPPERYRGARNVGQKHTSTIHKK